ncbi:heme/hemin ABC transporter substrate-binding protein [Croceimicrobium sp.]|uniref:heme/hemin ABC transporter substrate-binding protein n=1 Tax=Croceimicrobium sp. TaxID=2828340 RepID=UPI003BADA76D
MKNLYISALVFLLGAQGCGRFQNAENESKAPQNRIVCLSKQYTELLYALDLDSNLVAVDLSSTYPPETAQLTTVGYHRALSAEAVLAVEPSLILHDNNIGPEHVQQQLENSGVPIKAFDTKSRDWDGTLELIREMGSYFKVSSKADSLIISMHRAMEHIKREQDSSLTKPKVLVIHFGRASNVYLVMTAKSTGAKMIELAGGTVPFEGKGGMRPLSPEVFAEMNPDIILMTNFGYDRLGGQEEILNLPGVRHTKAAQEGRIYRIEEHDLVYFGPRSPQNIQLIRKFIRDEA